MKVILHVNRCPERWSQVCQATIPEHFEGYTSALTLGGNTVLSGSEIRFDGQTRQEVIDQVIEELHNRNLHGSLKVIG